MKFQTNPYCAHAGRAARLFKLKADDVQRVADEVVRQMTAGAAEDPQDIANREAAIIVEEKAGG